jgi:stage V sporulation protein B
VLVLALVSPFNNVMVTATIQGVSKFASEMEGRVAAVTRAALRMQLGLGGATALAFFLGAPLIAWFMHDPSLTSILRLASGVLLAYSFYAVFVGAANGARAFHKQAGLDMTFATLRAGLVVGAALLTRSATAAVGGFVAAALLILMISSLVVGLGPAPAERFPTARLARYFVGVAAYLLVVNLLMFVDGYLVKRLCAEAAAAAGRADATAFADAQEGFYGAVQAVARIPYQLILAVTFVIFPLVSRATFERDAERARGYVRTTMRYSLVASALLGAAVAARPEAVMRLFYKPEYAVGAAALGWLSAGYVFFSLFNIAATILNSAGKTALTAAIAGGTLLVAIVANQVGISLALEHGEDPLRVAAAATAAAMAVGLVAAGVSVRRVFGAFLPPLTVARTTLATAAALAVGRLWPADTSKIGTLVAASAAGAAFLLVAVASGELRLAELRRSRRKN